MRIVNTLDRDNEINKIIQTFKNNEEFDFFYDREKEEVFLRKNNKNYTGKYEEIKNFIDTDFNCNILSTYYLSS